MKKWIYPVVSLLLVVLFCACQTLQPIFREYVMDFTANKGGFYTNLAWFSVFAYYFAEGILLALEVLLFDPREKPHLAVKPFLILAYGFLALLGYGFVKVSIPFFTYDRALLFTRAMRFLAVQVISLLKWPVVHFREKKKHTLFFEKHSSGLLKILLYPLLSVVIVIAFVVLHVVALAISEYVSTYYVTMPSVIFNWYVYPIVTGCFFVLDGILFDPSQASHKATKLLLIAAYFYLFLMGGYFVQVPTFPFRYHYNMISHAATFFTFQLFTALKWPIQARQERRSAVPVRQRAWSRLS